MKYIAIFSLFLAACCGSDPTPETTHVEHLTQAREAIGRDLDNREDEPAPPVLPKPDADCDAD